MLLTGVWRKRRSKRMECGHLPAQAWPSSIEGLAAGVVCGDEVVDALDELLDAGER